MSIVASTTGVLNGGEPFSCFSIVLSGGAAGDDFTLHDAASTAVLINVLNVGVVPRIIDFGCARTFPNGAKITTIGGNLQACFIDF